MHNHQEKPLCTLVGENGNIFNLMAVAGKALKQAGQREQYVEMQRRIEAEAHSYGQALAIIAEYVGVE